MVKYTMNLINKIHYEYERRNHYVIMSKEYLITYQVVLQK